MKRIPAHTLILFCAAITFSFSSCKKKWKEPTEVSFRFQLNSSANTGPVKFTDAFIMLSRVTISADRKQSPPHIELQQSPNGMPVSFSAGAPSPSLKFDIPQGTYSNISLKYETTTDHANSERAVQINGTYTDSSGATLAVQFTFSAADAISLTAKNSSGGNEITLVEGKPVTATIVIDPAYWFAAIPRSELEDAEQQMINNVLTISIDKDNNDDLYQLIVNRIKDGNQFIFN